MGGNYAFQPEGGGDAQNWIWCKARDDGAKRSLEEAHVGVQAVQNKEIEAAFRVGQAMEKMFQITKPLEANLEPAGRRTQVRRHRLLGGVKKAMTMWGQMVRKPSRRRRNFRSNKDVTVQCIDFCEATTSEVHAVLRYAPATVAYQENPPLCLQILHAARFQVFRGAYILLRVLADTKSQEAQGLLEEIRRQSGVFVLSGPATVITIVATASVFLAKGWSTESVSRVVRTARTRQEKHEKERAEHAYYSHIHDEVTVSDAFPATIQRLEED